MSAVSPYSVLTVLTQAERDEGLGMRNISFHRPAAHVGSLPDQAVPLTLLATEAFTNALKYAGTPAGGSAPWVSIRLSETEPGRALLVIENSVGDASRDSDGDGTRLGGQLIEAFSTQLDGEAEIQSMDDRYALRLEFTIVAPSMIGVSDPRNVVLTSAAREGSRH